MFRTLKMPSPVLLDDITWEQPTPATRRLIDIAVQVDRDSIFADFFYPGKQQRFLRPIMVRAKPTLRLTGLFEQLHLKSAAGGQ